MDATSSPMLDNAKMFEGSSSQIQSSDAGEKSDGSNVDTVVSEAPVDSSLGPALVDKCSLG